MGDLVIQLLINGIVAGSFYALAGVSWGIIYKTTRIFHFSHYLVFTIAGYAAVLITTNARLHCSFGFVAAIISAVLAGCSIEVFLYRKLPELAGYASNYISCVHGISDHRGDDHFVDFYLYSASFERISSGDTDHWSSKLHKCRCVNSDIKLGNDWPVAVVSIQVKIREGDTCGK